MCLETTKEVTEKFRKKNKNKKFIWAYKVYQVRNNRLYSVIYGINLISPGEIRSNRSRLSFDKRDQDNWYVDEDCNEDRIILWEISRGIHVFEKIVNTRNFSDFCSNRVIVRVKCLMKDFVAYDVVSKEAVFKKVYLDEKEYNKALREKY